MPLGHWAYDYIDILVERGRLSDLQPLVQPYRRIDIATSMRDAEDAGVLGSVEASWVGLIKRELKPEYEYLNGRSVAVVGVSAQIGIGAKALSQTHRDPLRPEGPSKAFGTLALHVFGNAPAVAGAFRFRWDGHYLNDPQFPNGDAIQFRACDPIVDQCAYRVEDAYVEVQVPFVRLGFGRMDRNWGLPGINGLQLSPYAYSYDVINYRFGSDRIALTGFFTPLNDFQGDTAHYISSHRLDWRATDNLSFSVGESVAYGGENRNVVFGFINPVGVWEISGTVSGNNERNTLGFIEAWWRPYGWFLTYGAFMIDNTSVGDESEGRDAGFNQYAGALSLRFPYLGPSLAASLDFSVVSALAYRSRIGFFEYYTFEDLGLARDKTDAVLLDARAEWYAATGLFLKPGVQLQWKGEDNIDQPWPDDAFTGRDRLLVGTVETTVRPVIEGRWTLPYGDVPWRGLTFEIAFDAGVNVVKNKDHQTADWDAEFVGSLWARVVQAFW